ncbi:MAG TPA: hypothetical protein GXX33_05240 [Firmicutes bacterium]|uniref:Uncharacterized protein n=1 Tax=Capillibacterium thermochitinicola TaxID=2699427 RepID=A0A8J6LM23_9FIRM|nr:hypothetical protein [Capillibacterium thermochitinicola]MBA2132603.1 hypothetical protein [Capillibacterium thermochitinicola]HHW12390.1 hypothetical protein [Bacillota bacterium]
MKIRSQGKIAVLCLVFLLLSLSANALTTEEFPLHPIDKDRPFSLELKEDEGQKCELRMVRVKGNAKIAKPPQIDANVLYYAEAKLGNPAKVYGLLVDLEGEKKQIWVDADADLDFAEERGYELFKSDRYPGLNVYYAPMPLSFNVTYKIADEEYSIPVSFDLPYLIVARAGYHDFLLLRTRTWLAGHLYIEDEEIPIALVDTDFNGCFNDPQDLLFLDTNYDLNFSAAESLTIKRAAKPRIKPGIKVELNFKAVPKKIIVQY